MATWDAITKTDHVAESPTLLLEQFHGSARVEALTTVFATLVQELEDQLWSMLTLRGLDVATGDQLDQLGKIVGQPRLGLADEDYRAQIRVKIRLNVSNGQALDVIKVALLYENLTATGSVEVREYAPAALVVEYTNPLTHTPASALAVLNKARAAGVGLQLVYPTTSADTSLIGGDAAAYPQVSATQGGGSTTDATIGGYSAGVIT